MKLGKKDARLAADLLDGKELRLGKTACEKGLSARLIKDGFLEVKRVSANSRRVSAKDTEALRCFLLQAYGIPNVESLLEILEDETPTRRADLAKIGIGTKYTSIRPKSGMHINSPNGAAVTIDGSEVALSFPPYCALFVNRSAKIEIGSDVVIVGVENFENITFATQQAGLIKRDAPMIFVERGPVMRNWVASLKNEYIHFGDIDLAGIGIYLREFAPHLSCPKSFFIPDDILERIEKNKGSHSRELYRSHLKQYGNIKTEEARLQELIDFIHLKKRGIEQESLIL